MTSPILHVVEKQRGLGKPVTIVAVLEIEIERIARSRDLQRERGLADLSWPNQRHGGLTVQGALDVGSDDSRNHPCNLSTLWIIYKE